MIAFQLWREYKLSIAELTTVFPEATVVFFTPQILVLDNIDTSEVLKKATTLWGTIKIMQITDFDNITSLILHSAEQKESGKYNYGVSLYNAKESLKPLLLSIKKELKSNSISSRFVNKDFKNLSSAQIIGEKLVQKGSDFSVIYTPLLNKERLGVVYTWITIWVQDINSYSKRDWWKGRDMQVGMLPPKLSQIMINLSSPLLAGEGLGVRLKKVYDPFVWLGTILIESLYMWNKQVYGSDLSESMVEISEKNITQTISQNNFTEVEYNIQKLNAKFIEEADILKNTVDINIVTEWYLWEIMTQKNISIERIEKQKESLIKIYEAFFTGLQKINFWGTIVISFPFWEIKWKYIYFTEIYDVLNTYCNIAPILPENIELEATKSWSLLYKREKQLVWREIFKLTIQ